MSPRLRRKAIEMGLINHLPPSQIKKSADILKMFRLASAENSHRFTKDFRNGESEDHSFLEAAQRKSYRKSISRLLQTREAREI